MTEGADNSGILYVLTNPAMPNIVKIGKTTDLERRIGELSRHAGVPLPFDCVRAVKVNNMDQAEVALQTAFKQNRVNPNPRKEFFEIEPEQAIAILDLIGIEDVTPGRDELGDVDLLERSASDRFKRQTRRPLLKFGDLNIPVGAKLQFTQDERVTVEVVDDQTTVSYQEDTYLIASLTKDLLGSQRGVSAQQYWRYESRLLREIYNEAHPQEIDED